MKRRVGVGEISGIPPGHVPIAVVDQVHVSAGLDSYLSLKALAGYAGISRRTLQVYLHASHDPLPHLHIGGKILVQKSTYDKWTTRFQCRRAADLDQLVNQTLRDLHEATPRQ